MTLGFQYNPENQITVRTSSNDLYAYKGAYSVDRSYSSNGLNQNTSSGPVRPTYDARGNLVNAGEKSYTYNSKNHLFQTSSPGELFYRNPVGLLNHIISGNSVTNLDYVGPDLVTEFDGGSGAVTRRYVYGPESDEPLVWYEGAGTADRRYLHADERGSIIAISNDQGNVSTINSYDEYGIPGPSNQGRFQFTGQKWISELGMYDFKARMYSPTLGRFLQPDPLEYEEGLNWYAYGASDPINARDPSGMACVTLAGPERTACEEAEKLPPIVVTGRKTSSLPFGFSIFSGVGSYPQGNSTYSYGSGTAATRVADCATCVLRAIRLLQRLAVRELKVAKKIKNQAPKRGWSAKDLFRVLRNGKTGVSQNKATGNTASVYGKGNEYFVIDDVTKEVIQVSDRLDPTWAPDQSIVFF